MIKENINEDVFGTFIDRKNYEELKKLAGMRIPISEEFKNLYREIEKDELDVNETEIDQVVFLKRFLHKVLFLTDAIYPALLVITKIESNKGINISSLKDIFELRATVPKTYDLLKKLQKKHAISLIKQVPCSSFCYDAIIDAFEKSNKEKFVKVIYDNKCDITKLSMLANIKNSVEGSLGLFEKLHKNEVDLSNEEINAGLEHILSLDLIPRELEKALEYCIIDYEQKKISLNRINIQLEWILPTLLNIILGGLEDEENGYKIREIKLIKSILCNPEHTDIYNYYLHMIENEEANNNTEDTLPKDYFNLALGEEEVMQHTISKDVESDVNQYRNRFPMPSGFDDEKLEILHKKFYGYIDSNQPLIFFLGGNQIVPIESVIHWNGKRKYLQHFIKGLYGITNDGKEQDLEKGTWEKVANIFLLNGKPFAVNTFKRGPAPKDSETERIVRLINDIREGKIME